MQATTETAPGQVLVHPLESVAFDVRPVIVAGVERDVIVNDVFEGPIEVVRDCRETSKVGVGGWLGGRYC